MIIIQLLIVVLAAIPLSAQVTLWDPVAGSNYCRITAVSGATPAVVTVDDISKCALTNDGKVFIADGRNTSATATAAMNAINSHPDNATDENYVRCVKNISGNTFHVYKGDCTTAITSNGSYWGGGWLFRVVSRTTTASPMLYGDGPSGAFTTALKNSGTGGWAESSRPITQTLNTLADNFIGSYAQKYGSDFSGQMGSLCALRWYGKNLPGSDTARTCAMWAANNSHQVWPAMPCDGTQNCGHSNSGYNDYVPNLYARGVLITVDLMMPHLSAGERNALIAYWLDDLPWENGGHNYSGTTLTAPAWKTISGTITTTSGSTTVAGSGTAFTTQLAAGDFITVHPVSVDAFAQLYRVQSIASDTSLTLEVGHNSNYSNVAWRAARAYQTGDLGLLYMSKAGNIGILCGADIFQNPTVPTGCPDYMPQSGQGSAIMLGNLPLGRANFLVGLGLGFSNYDIRARWLYTHAAGTLYFHALPKTLSAFTGLTVSSTNGYHGSRIAEHWLWFAATMKKQTGNDYVPVALVDSLVRWNMFQWTPGRPYTLHVTQERAADNAGIGDHAGTFWAMWQFASRPIMGIARHFIENTFTQWTTVRGQYAQYVANAYIGHRPDLTATAPSNGTGLFPSLRPECLSLFTASLCAPEQPRTAIVSLSSPSSINSAASWFWNMVSFGQEDHQTQQPEFGLYMTANGKQYLRGDGSGGYVGGVAPFGNTVIGSSSLKTAFPSYGKTIITRMAGNATVAGGSADLRDHYVSAPATLVRSFLHAKGTGAGDYVMERIDASESATTRYPYSLIESCGTPTAATCVAKAGDTVTHTQTGGKMMSRALVGAFATEGGSDSNGSYTGGSGFTFRVGLTGTTSVIVHRWSSNTGETLPTITQIAVGNLRGAQIGDAKVMLMAGPTSQATTASFTTTHAATIQYAVLGLAPGSWNFKRNGTTVCTVSVLAGEELGACDMQSGAIELETAGAPPSSGLRGKIGGATVVRGIR